MQQLRLFGFILLFTSTAYADSGSLLKVNGAEIYVEVSGSGQPLVLMHGGGSDAQVSFGKGIPALSKHFKVIAIDEQNHGKSPASSRKFGFEQTADDIAEILKQLKIESTMFLGFSNGATTGMYLAIRHPKLVSKMVLGSGLYHRSGAFPGFWNIFEGEQKPENMPKELQEAYKKRAPKPEDLSKMFQGDSNRMRTFKDVPEKGIRGVKIPVLIMQTDQDVATIEHAVQTVRKLPKARLAILPGPHDNFLGSVSNASPEMTQASLAIITEFLLAK